MPPILAIVLQAPIMVVLMEVGYSSAVNMWTMSNAPEIDQVHIDEAQDGVDSEMDLVSTEGEAIIDEGGNWPADKHNQADLEDRTVENI